MLRPGGRLGVLEFFRPESTGSRLVHGAYNRLALPVLGRHPLAGSRRRTATSSRSMERFASRPEFEDGRAAGRLPRRARRDALPRRVRARHGGARVKLVVAVSGASGAPYARRLLDFLAANGRDARRLGGPRLHPDRQAGLEAGDRLGAALPVPRLEEPGLHRAVRVRARRSTTGWWSIPCSAGALARIALRHLGGPRRPRRRRDAEGAQAARARAARDAHLARARAGDDAGHRGGRVRDARLAVVLLGAEDDRRARGHGRRARARPARPAERRS